MKDITPAEKDYAIKISQALQLHFDQNPGVKIMRSTDAYDVLVTKGLVERDRHHGIKFREFLKKLKNANAMVFIPQCTAEPGNSGFTNWVFRSASKATMKFKNVKIKVADSPVDEGLINKAIQIIASLPKRDTSKFDFKEEETRKTYPRAYEYWTQPEIDLLVKIKQQIPSTLELSKIFKRQPSAIENRINTL